MKREISESFKVAMKSTNSYRLHSIRIIWWCIFNRSKAQLFVDKVNSGMHWWAAFDAARNNT